MKIAYTPKTTVYALATLSALALLVAIVSERRYGYAPCELCLVQRGWHCAVVAAALVAAMLPRYRTLLAIQTFALIGCFGFSLFHIGVEHHMWEGTRACTAVSANPVSNEQDLTLQILSTPTERCDAPRWFLFGLSMAVYDAILTGFMMLFAAFTLARKR